jgi:hypothetical protein
MLSSPPKYGFGFGGDACLLHIHMAPQEVNKIKIQEKKVPHGSIAKPEAFIRP